MSTTTSKTVTRKAPQDRKPKAVDGYQFTGADGKTHVIPHPSKALEMLPGRAFRDGLMGGEEGQLKMAFTCLELVCDDKAHADTLNALYDMSAPNMIQIVGDWFASADVSGATLGE
jgi:hypothetical protein